MKKIKTICLFFFISVFLLPFIGQTVAKPTYVGVHENSVCIWQNRIIKDGYVSWYNDGGNSFINYSGIDFSIEYFSKKVITLIGEQIYDFDYECYATKVYYESYLTFDYIGKDTDWGTKSLYFLSIYNVDQLLDEFLADWLWGGPYFVSINVNWSKASAALDTWVESDAITGDHEWYKDNVTECFVKASNSGVYINVTFENMDAHEINMTYTNEGINNVFWMKYKSEKMLESQLIFYRKEKSDNYSLVSIILIVTIIVGLIGVSSILIYRGQKKKREEIFIPTPLQPIADIKGLKYCPECGTMLIKKDQNFCTNCSAPLKS